MRLALLLLSLTVALGLPLQAGATPSASHTDKSAGAGSASSASDSAGTQADEAGPTVIRSKFGLFFPPSSGKKKFVSSRTVPWTPNQAYGWRLVVKRQPGKMRWREEFVLPAAPSSWGGSLSGVKQDVSADGKTSVREGELQDNDNVLTSLWTVVEGDPKGKHVIRVYLDDKLVHSFDFELE